MRATREKVMALATKHPGMRILAAHDPAATQLLAVGGERGTVTEPLSLGRAAG